MDGFFFPPFTGDQRKIAIALKGAGTLFADLSTTWRLTFHECATRHQHAPMSAEGRRELMDIVNARGTVKSPPPNQGVIFRVGSADRAAIHSEPPIVTRRLFLSIVPGNQGQVEELRARWGRPVRPELRADPAETSVRQEPQ
jgi:hypothetical protein